MKRKAADMFYWLPNKILLNGFAHPPDVDQLYSVTYIYGLCFSKDPWFKRKPFLSHRGTTGSLPNKIIMKMEEFFKFVSGLGS